MEYLDFCIQSTSDRYSPLHVDAIYYVFADESYNVQHLKIPNSYVFVATLSGSGTIEVENQTYVLEAGDIFLFDASKANFTYHCNLKSWNFWWFEFRAPLRDFLDLPLLQVVSHPLNAYEIYLCEESLCSLKLKDSKTTSSLFSALICLLQKQTAAKQNDSRGIETFKKADAYIRKHLSTATVKATAEALQISERTLLALFRNELNISTVQYINNLKTDMARHLLLTGEMNIQAIAETLGYPDQFVFSKSFKKRFGLSPRKYKAKENSQA